MRHRVAPRLARSAADVTLTVRRLTSRWRALPTFFVVGAQKAGTTSFFDYLVQHPRIFPSFLKEVHYFDLNYPRGEGWYRSFFPLRSRMRAVRASTGEASPYYLFHPAVPGRIHRAVSDARIFILLRDPTERAVSHYEHERRLGNETLSLSRALEAEERRLHGEEARLGRDGYVSWSHQHHSYRARGFYQRQIERYHELFGRERTRVILSDDLFSDPLRAVQDGFAFLGVDPSFAPRNLEAKGVNRERAATMSADAAAIRSLREGYAQANVALAEYLGRSLPWPSA